MATFSQQISDFAGKTQQQIEDEVNLICMQLVTRVIRMTPVDTGRARANWQASLNTPVTGSTAKTDKNGGTTINAASADAAKAAGNIFYLSNNLPYILHLEYGLYGAGPKTVGGFSKQAPAGMVRIAIKEVARSHQ